MKHLAPAIMADYDIPAHRPTRIVCAQFTDSPLALGLVDRLLDDLNAGSQSLGVALISPDHAAHLKSQEGLFTAFVRGELNDQPVHKEQVVQSILTVLDPADDDPAIQTLAGDASLRFLILEQNTPIQTALAARFLVERWQRHAPAIPAVILGEDQDCADEMKARIRSCAEAWQAGEAFFSFLEDCRFYPSLADCLTYRSSAAEAARLCAEMNYADAMIHLAEPYGLWAIQADEAFRAEFPLDEHPQIEFVDDVAPCFTRKQRIFDAGLFAITALGCLHGNETLAECMKDEPLRDLVGHALLDELLPYAPFERDQLIPYIIASYERYSNPMNDNLLTDAAKGLIKKFNKGVLPAIRAHADEHFEPPKNLTVALAATIFLYADARLRENGYETVVGQTLIPLQEDPEIMEAFSCLASDMAPDSLAYAVLSDRTLWNGEDLRDIPGLEEAIINNLSN